MEKAIVFDLGGTLMEYVGMPSNWSDYYIYGFEKINDFFKLDLSEEDLQESVSKLKSYNPRISKREYELEPAVIFRDVISGWKKKPDIHKLIELFFDGLKLKATTFDYSIGLLENCKNNGLRTACLTDLPNGMPDDMFRSAIAELLPYFDLYVSSQICGVRKPAKGGICYIAEIFGIHESEILFVGDEEKTF